MTKNGWQSDLVSSPTTGVCLVFVVHCGAEDLVVAWGVDGCAPPRLLKKVLLSHSFEYYLSKALKVDHFKGKLLYGIKCISVSNPKKRTCFNTEVDLFRRKTAGLATVDMGLLAAMTLDPKINLVITGFH